MLIQENPCPLFDFPYRFFRRFDNVGIPASDALGNHQRWYRIGQKPKRNHPRKIKRLE